MIERPGAVNAPAEPSTNGTPALMPDTRPVGSRLRELLVIIAVLAAVAGIGALMVACTAH